jgi:hypothetical protein
MGNDFSGIETRHGNAFLKDKYCRGGKCLVSWDQFLQVMVILTSDVSHVTKIGRVGEMAEASDILCDIRLPQKVTR